MAILPYGTYQVVLRQEEKQILACCKEKWLGTFKKKITDYTIWERLFGISITVSQFLEDMADFVSCQFIRYIDVEDWSANISKNKLYRFFDSPLLEHVTFLTLEGRSDFDEAENLLGDRKVEKLCSSILHTF